MGTKQIDLSDFFTTRAQASDFAARLSVISEKIYETNFDLNKELMEQFGIQKADKFISLLRDNAVYVGSQAALKDCFQVILKTISELPVLDLTIAIEPKEDTLKEVSQWLLLNINKQVLLNFRVDPNIIAGAIISYNGKHVDCSIRQKFDEIAKDIITKPSQAYVPSGHQSTEHFTIGR